MAYLLPGCSPIFWEPLRWKLWMPPSIGVTKSWSCSRHNNRMKKYADLHRQEWQLDINQQVYLRLQPYRQISISARRDLKLAPRFYGPFTVIRKVGFVAYELDLPPESCIHPVFHVSQLKSKLGTNVSHFAGRLTGSHQTRAHRGFESPF
jgi:hypothetical protein